MPPSTLRAELIEGHRELIFVPQDNRKLSNVRQWDPKAYECQVSLFQTLRDREGLTRRQLLLPMDPHEHLA